MSYDLNVIIVDDDPAICEMVSEIVKNFYIWGKVYAFTDADKATAFCLDQETGVAIFILDVYLEDRVGFMFLDGILEKFPTAYEDTIVISGDASDEVVDVCIASDIACLLEKPIRPYALQMAIRAIVSKYIKFAKRLLENPALAKAIAGI